MGQCGGCNIGVGRTLNKIECGNSYYARCAQLTNDTVYIKYTIYLHFAYDKCLNYTADKKPWHCVLCKTKRNVETSFQTRIGKWLEQGGRAFEHLLKYNKPLSKYIY